MNSEYVIEKNEIKQIQTLISLGVEIKKTNWRFKLEYLKINKKDNRCYKLFFKGSEKVLI
tara:strand:+ start:639 stop:818 length:180 start_codon:yes stop_codon:yes gene_type:complete